MLQFRILNDHIFFASSENSLLHVICLVQAMEFSSVSSSETKVHDAGVLEISSVNMSSGPPVDIEYIHIQYFSYIPSFTESRQASKVTALVMGLDERLEVFQSTFDTSRSGPMQWSTYGKMYSSSPSFLKHGDALKFVSEPSRSGRILWTLSDKEYALFALSCDGDLALVHVSNVPTTNEIVWYSDSDALVTLKDRGSGKDTIELYYPLQNK